MNIYATDEFNKILGFDRSYIFNICQYKHKSVLNKNDKADIMHVIMNYTFGSADITISFDYNPDHKLITGHLFYHTIIMSDSKYKEIEEHLNFNHDNCTSDLKYINHCDYYFELMGFKNYKTDTKYIICPDYTDIIKFITNEYNNYISKLINNNGETIYETRLC